MTCQIQSWLLPENQGKGGSISPTDLGKSNTISLECFQERCSALPGGRGPAALLTATGQGAYFPISAILNSLEFMPELLSNSKYLTLQEEFQC